MVKESESEQVHQHSSSVKLTEPRLSFPHDGKCRLPSEGDQSRCRSTVENCKNEHRSHQVSYQNHYVITKATKSVRILNHQNLSHKKRLLELFKSIRLVISTKRRRHITETKANQPSIDLNINS